MKRDDFIVWIGMTVEAVEFLEKEKIFTLQEDTESVCGWKFVPIKEE